MLVPKRQTNQLRQKIGVVFGNPETTTGGNALKFYCSVRLDIRKGKPIRRGDELVGNQTRVKVVKNKMAPPFREAHFEILYGQGVHRTAELVDAAEGAGMLAKNGTWYSYKGTRLAQGREKMMAYLDDNPTSAAELRASLLEQVRARIVTATSQPAPERAAA